MGNCSALLDSCVLVAAARGAAAGAALAVARHAALAVCAALAVAGCTAPPQRPAALEPVRVSDDGRAFEIASGRPLVPWGFNYDRDAKHRLLEDYWQDEWPAVESDFREMRALGANVVRIHLQLGRFMRSETEPDAASLDRLRELLRLAERIGLYLVVTGLGAYREADVPAWYDALGEDARWAVQARFWEAVAEVGSASPAVFAYDLMNEPLAPRVVQPARNWLAPPFGGERHFTQWIALDPRGRTPFAIAVAWIRTLTEAIRRRDARALVTLGLVDWSLEFGRIRSGFVPRQVAPELDFVSVHFYPESGRIDAALETLDGFAAGKPVLIEEMFPLRCSVTELAEFVTRSRGVAAGWLGFYWGETPAELAGDTSPAGVATREWLAYFAAEAARGAAGPGSASPAGGPRPTRKPRSAGRAPAARCGRRPSYAWVARLAGRAPRRPGSTDHLGSGS